MIYNLKLKTDTDFDRSYLLTSRFGLNSPFHFSSKVWDIVLSDMKTKKRYVFKHYK